MSVQKGGRKTFNKNKSYLLNCINDTTKYGTCYTILIKLLVEPRSGCETIVLRLSVCLSVCVSVCPSAKTLKWYNIVNSQYIAIQLYTRVDTP